ncbi:MAG: hypothetical protein DMG07_14060, partial [Acidobacteria bacterium]
MVLTHFARRILWVPCILLWVTAPVWGQIDKCSVVGRVQDQSGGVVPGVRVELKRVSTNEVFPVLTSSSGDYTIVSLVADTYALTVAQPGFKTYVRSGLVLEIGRTYRFDVTLTLGESSERIEVTASAPLLRTETPEQSNVIENAKILGLPNKGRDHMAFVGLLPGVAPVRNSYGEGTAGLGFNVNGQRKVDNLIWMDGGIIGDSNGSSTIYANLDAIQEVEVKTSLYDAEFGLRPGGQVSAVTKSGTNQFHGTTFEFHRRNDFEARNFFDPGEPPFYRRNIFGGTLGGPILLPKVFDGRDKMWFFYGYSGERRQRGISLTGVMPTLDQRQARFAKPILDPLTGAPFPNNTIPSSRINPVAQKLLPFWPEPNTTGQAYNYVSPNSSEDFSGSQHIAKIDWRTSNRDRWSARFLYNSAPFIINNVIQRFATTEPYTTWSQTISNTHTFRSTVVNDVTAHYYYLHYQTVGAAGDLPGFGKTLGFSNWPSTTTDQDGIPTTSVLGYTALGHRSQFGPADETFQEIRDNLSFYRGKHSLKIGYHLRKRAEFGAIVNRSSLSFDTRYTGDPFANFLIGAPSSSNLGAESYRLNYHAWSHNLYIQDSWKALPNLTISLGLRYEYRRPWFDKRGFSSNFDPVRAVLDPPLLTTTVQPWQTGRFVANVPVLEYVNTNFQPRVGLAYRLSDKLVVRSGFSIFTNEPQGGIVESLGSQPRPNAATRTFLSDPSTPTLSLSDPFNGPLASGGTLFNLRGIENPLPVPRMFSWGLTLQYELTRKTVVEAAYIGSNSVHQFGLVGYNDAGPGTAPRQDRRPYPQYQNINFVTGDNRNNVQSLQTRIEHRPGVEGLTLLLSYTWLKSI